MRPKSSLVTPYSSMYRRAWRPTQPAGERSPNGPYQESQSGIPPPPPMFPPMFPNRMPDRSLNASVADDDLGGAGRDRHRGLHHGPGRRAAAVRDAGEHRQPVDAEVAGDLHLLGRIEGEGDEPVDVRRREARRRRARPARTRTRAAARCGPTPWRTRSGRSPRSRPCRRAAHPAARGRPTSAVPPTCSPRSSMRRERDLDHRLVAVVAHAGDLTGVRHRVAGVHRHSELDRDAADARVRARPSR